MDILIIIACSLILMRMIVPIGMFVAGVLYFLFSLTAYIFIWLFMPKTWRAMHDV